MGDFDAESAKKAGNDMFSSGDYEGACMKYTDAIMMGVDQGCTFHSKLLSNRSLCNLKLQRFNEAEADASGALREDPSNTKALRHRGIARSNIDGQEDLALADLEEFMSKSGGKKMDKTATKVLRKLRGRNGSSSSSSSSSSSKGASKETKEALTPGRVEYTVEKVGEGEIFDLWRVSFQVPIDGLKRLSGGRASVQARGGVFELVANEEAGCVETTIETPDPKAAADAIAERIHLRINSNDSFTGMEACLIM